MRTAIAICLVLVAGCARVHDTYVVECDRPETEAADFREYDNNYQGRDQQTAVRAAERCVEILSGESE